MRRDIPISEQKLLFGFSAGCCAYPDCPVINMREATDDDQAAVIGEIAHIMASSDQGPRADKTMPGPERNKYANLILFCPTHHTVVDKQPNTFTVEDLRRWKCELEAKVRDAIRTIMPQVSFSELESVTHGLLGLEDDGASDLSVIPPREKMQRNGLSSVTGSYLAIALAKSNVVGSFIDHFTRVDRRFAERLRSGLVAKYKELFAHGRRGDELFEEMLSFASFNQRGLKYQAAGLAVLGYFFEACEVFEK